MVDRSRREETKVVPWPYFGGHLKEHNLRQWGSGSASVHHWPWRFGSDLLRNWKSIEGCGLLCRTISASVTDAYEVNHVSMPDDTVFRASLVLCSAHETNKPWNGSQDFFKKNYRIWLHIQTLGSDKLYCQTPNISLTLVGNKIVDH